MTELAWCLAAVLLGTGGAGGAVAGRARVAVLAARARLGPRGARRRPVAPTRAGRCRAAALAGQWAGPGGAVGIVAVTGGVGVAGGPALGLAAGVALAMAALVARDAVAGRRLLVRRAELLAGVRALVAELQAGARPALALAAAADSAPSYRGPFRAAAGALASGGDAAAALLADADTRAVGLAWRLGAQTGAAAGGVLDRVAADLAAADEQRRVVDVALAGPRSSAVLLTGLPALGLGLGMAMGAHPLTFLLTTPPGRLVCCAGILLDAAGVLWMRHILRRAQVP